MPHVNALAPTAPTNTDDTPPDSLPTPNERPLEHLRSWWTAMYECFEAITTILLVTALLIAAILLLIPTWLGLLPTRTPDLPRARFSTVTSASSSTSSRRDRNDNGSGATAGASDDSTHSARKSPGSSATGAPSQDIDGNANKSSQLHSLRDFKDRLAEWIAGRLHTRSPNLAPTDTSSTHAHTHTNTRTFEENRSASNRNTSFPWPTFITTPMTYAHRSLINVLTSLSIVLDWVGCVWRSVKAYVFSAGFANLVINVLLALVGSYLMFRWMGTEEGGGEVGMHVSTVVERVTETVRETVVAIVESITEADGVVETAIGGARGASASADVYL